MSDKPIRIRIAGGPLARDIKVTDAETGRPISGVRSFRARGEAGGLVEVTLELIDAEVDLVGSMPT